MIDTVKQIIDIFSGLVGPITAACVGYIAYRQWKSDELDKARKEIEKRIDIYKVVSEHLSYVDRNLRVSPELYDRFRLAHCEAKFYFPSSVSEFLKRIDSNSHQWLLEFDSLQQQGLSESDDLHDNLDELTSCSVELESNMAVHVMNGQA